MLALLILLNSFFYAPDIYAFSVPAIDGTTIHFSDFKGKKMLLVNIASNSPYAKQLASLEKLYELHRDSLVVIAFPSDDFGNEPGDGTAIRNWAATVGAHFLIAAKGPAFGGAPSSFCQWLTTGKLNERMTHPVDKDFQKYLINEQGEMAAFFASFVDPMDELITNTL
jgi:glutathione peroxidase